MTGRCRDAEEHRISIIQCRLDMLAQCPDIEELDAVIAGSDNRGVIELGGYALPQLFQCVDDIERMGEIAG